MEKRKCILLAIITSIVLTALIFFIIFINRPQDVEEFNCQAQFNQDTYANNSTSDRIRTTAIVTVYLTKNNGGFFSMTGTIKDGSVIYDLRRVVSFSISQDTLLGMKKMIIKNVDISLGDNTPDKIWNNNVIPEKTGTPLYVNFKKINSNTIIINSLSLPYLICVIQKN